MWTAEEQKRRRIWSVVVILLQLMNWWVTATSRPFATNDDAHQQGQTPQSLPSALDSKQVESMERKMMNEEEYKWLSTLGSRPPNCEHKCGGCIPCEAIQVPTTTDHLGIQYANYEPEGWKCKCGASFFNP